VLGKKRKTTDDPAAPPDSAPKKPKLLLVSRAAAADVKTAALAPPPVKKFISRNGQQPKNGSDGVPPSANGVRKLLFVGRHIKPEEPPPPPPKKKLCFTPRNTREKQEEEKSEPPPPAILPDDDMPDEQVRANWALASGRFEQQQQQQQANGDGDYQAKISAQESIAQRAIEERNKAAAERTHQQDGRREDSDSDAEGLYRKQQRKLEKHALQIPKKKASAQISEHLTSVNKVIDTEEVIVPALVSATDLLLQQQQQPLLEQEGDEPPSEKRVIERSVANTRMSLVTADFANRMSAEQYEQQRARVETELANKVGKEEKKIRKDSEDVLRQAAATNNDDETMRAVIEQAARDDVTMKRRIAEDKINPLPQQQLFYPAAVVATQAEMEQRLLETMAERRFEVEGGSQQAYLLMEQFERNANSNCFDANGRGLLHSMLLHGDLAINMHQHSKTHSHVRDKAIVVPPMTRAFEESLLREPRAGERPCSSDFKCQGFINPCVKEAYRGMLSRDPALRSWTPFVLVERMSPEELADLSKLPTDRRRCILCERYDMLYFWFQMRADRNAIRHSYCNQHYRNLVNQAGEYDLRDCIFGLPILVAPVVFHNPAFLAPGYTGDGLRCYLQTGYLKYVEESKFWQDMRSYVAQISEAQERKSTRNEQEERQQVFREGLVQSPSSLD
jgi:hypothetical protein